MSQAAVSQRKVDGGKVKGAQAVPNTVEIFIKQTGANGKSANFACYGQYATTPPSLVTLASALWTSISTAWGNDLGPQMHPNSQMTAVWLRDMANVNNPVVVGTGTAVPGTGTGIALPPETCIVITENINKRGKGLKGRMYVSGFVDTASAGSGIISPAGMAAVTSFANALFAAITAQSLTPCVAEVHRQAYTGLTGTPHLDRPAAPVGVTQYVVRNNEFDTQRRRGLNG